MFLTSGSKTNYDKHIVADDRSWTAKFQYYYNGTWSSLSIGNLQSFQISDYSTDGSNISIGSVVGGKLTLNLIKVTKTVATRLSRGTYIKVQLILSSSASTSTVTMTSGAFVIDESKLTLRQGGTYNVSLTAYDFSYGLSGKYTATGNMSAVEILNDIGNKCGFTVGESVLNAITDIDGSSGAELETTGVLGGAYLGTTGEWMDDEGETYSKNTGFVEVKRGETYEYYGKGYSVVASVLWYDADKNFLYSDTYNNGSNGLTTVTVTPPDDAKYAIFQSFNSTSNVTLSVTVVGGVTKYTPIADTTYKQTIGYMAGCYGCFAYFDNNLELQFGWYESSDDVISSNRIFSDSAYIAEMEERTIVMLETGTSDNPIVLPNNAKGFSINFENPYITQTQAEAIYNKRIADGKITFKIGKLSYKGSPLNNPRTIVTVKDVQNQGYPFYVMKRTLRYDGGLSETIECQGESETTINYKLTSPTQQKINRALSRMEEAIKKATDIITQTKGSVFELIPIDENDPSLGNSGWKLYSTEIGSNNLILANSSGIGFSSNGGQSFNAMALYIDENGVGHINADRIDVGELNGSIIKAGTISVSKNEVDGLNDELNSLLSSVNLANTTATNAESIANSANATAKTASSDASNALEKASSAYDATSVLSKDQQTIINICLNEDMTYINGGNIAASSILTDSIGANQITAEKIKAGAITADKLLVGDLTNYCRVNSVSYEAYGFSKVRNSSNIDAWSSDVEEWFTPNDYKKSYYLGDWVDFAYNKEGDNKFLYQGQLYNKSSSNTAYFCFSVMLDNGTTYIFNQGKGVNDVYFTGSGIHKFSKTLKMDYEYGGHRVVKLRPALYFDTAPSSTNWFAINDVTLRRATAGDITAGKLKSIDGNTYFDLDNSIIATNDARINGGYIQIGGDNYFTKIDAGAISQHLKSSTNPIGGLVPTGIDGKIYQTLYYENADGVDIRYKNEDGYFYDIASFSKEETRLWNELVTGYGVYLEGIAGVYGQYTNADGTKSNRLIGRLDTAGDLMLGYNYGKNWTQIYCGSDGYTNFYVGSTVKMSISKNSVDVYANDEKKVTIGSGYTPFSNIQYGTTNGVTESGSYVSLSGFTSAPTIICTPLSIYAGKDHRFVVAVSEVTKSSFTVKAKDLVGTYGVDVMWIAIGN